MININCLYTINDDKYNLLHCVLIKNVNILKLSRIYYKDHNCLNDEYTVNFIIKQGENKFYEYICVSGLILESTPKFLKTDIAGLYSNLETIYRGKFGNVKFGYEKHFPDDVIIKILTYAINIHNIADFLVLNKRISKYFLKVFYPQDLMNVYRTIGKTIDDGPAFSYEINMCDYYGKINFMIIAYREIDKHQLFQDVCLSKRIYFIKDKDDILQFFGVVFYHNYFDKNLCLMYKKF